jgi:hypothetical protein
MNEIWRFVLTEMERSGVVANKLKTWSDKGSTTSDSERSEIDEETFDLDVIKRR